MSINIALLRDTLETALATDDTFPARFYATLFARHPHLKALFTRNSDGAQHKMFAQKLAALVDHLEDPAWSEREIGALARSHAEYGATAEMYPVVGAALVDALREACGESWSAEAERAWGEAYDALSRAILATPVTAADVDSAPPSPRPSSHP